MPRAAKPVENEPVLVKEEPTYFEQVEEKMDASEMDVEPQPATTEEWVKQHFTEPMYGTTEIHKALVRAKKNMGPLLKDKTNPAFKSKYATLAATYGTISDALLAEDITDVQVFEKRFVQNYQTGEIIREATILVTILTHAPSGQEIRSELEVVTTDNKPQTLGSTITYLRRYMLQAMLGIAPEDDDANAAQTAAPSVSRNQTRSATVVQNVGPNVAKLRQTLKDRGITGSKAASDELAKVGYTGDFLAIDEATAGSLLEKIALF